MRFYSFRLGTALPCLFFVFFCAMLLAHFKGTTHKPVLSAAFVGSKRCFSFTRSLFGASKDKTNNDWTGDNSASGSSFPTGSPPYVSSTAYNYDKSSFDKLITYKVAVAYEPKERETSNIYRKPLKKSPAELSPTGEDNLFVSVQSEEGYLAVGVADGVGGWADAGYDSSAISRELCHFVKTQFESHPAKGEVSPRDLLIKAFDEVLKSPKVKIGGTTACVGVLTPDKKLKIANLGDSWCGLFRENSLIEETKFQTHNFNTPFQLAKIPQKLLRKAEFQGNRYIADPPEESDEYEWDLRTNDIIIFASDGVTDNVNAPDLELFLKDSTNSTLGERASQLVSKVSDLSKDPEYPSAFSQELSRVTGQEYVGGKEDDITIVMVKVL